MKWIIKAFVQAVLARAPGGMKINRLLQSRNWERWAAAQAMGFARSIQKADSFVTERGVAVEIGTGWIPVVPILLHMKGYEVHSYDVNQHVSEHTLNAALVGVRRSIGEIAEILEIENPIQKLDSFHWTYHAPGDAAETGLQEASLIFSSNVLEHVQAEDLVNIIGEAQRLGGVFYALIGLHDHFYNVDRSIGRVNFLKFEEKIWNLIGGHAIHFHNRLRASDYINMFSEFQDCYCEIFVDPIDVDLVKKMPLAERFIGYDVEDLAAHRLEYVGSKRFI